MGASELQRSLDCGENQARLVLRRSGERHDTLAAAVLEHFGEPFEDEANDLGRLGIQVFRHDIEFVLHGARGEEHACRFRQVGVQAA